MTLALLLFSEIVGLVTEMHTCADKVIDLFSGKGVSTDGNSHMDGTIMSNPAKLSYVFVQALRELAVGELNLFYVNI